MAAKESPLTRAKKHAADHTRNLEDTARAFALGRATTEDLLAVAKKATNAWHAVGRLRPDHYVGMPPTRVKR